jgi:23S rRNA pseudouridine2604 synthase
MKIEPIRLQKYLSESGFCSRRVAEDLIRQQKVLVNGEIATLGDKVTGEELILVNGEKIQSKSQGTKVIAWYKPRGIEVTFSNKHGGMTLLEAPGYSAMKDYLGGRMIPSGRLDKESEGLLLLTNDGAIANELMHPRYEHEKEYEVMVDKPITDEFLEQMSNGSIELEEKTVMPCEVREWKSSFLQNARGRKFNIILKEGRNRQIRKMCDALGYKVYGLKRIRMQNVELGELREGAWREVKSDELKMLNGL